MYKEGKFWQPKLWASLRDDQLIIKAYEYDISKQAPSVHKVTVTPALLHRRMNHTGFSALAKMAGAVDSLRVSQEEIEAVGAAGSVCEPCVMGKQHRDPSLLPPL